MLDCKLIEVLRNVEGEYRHEPVCPPVYEWFLVHGRDNANGAFNDQFHSKGSEVKLKLKVSGEDQNRSPPKKSPQIQIIYTKNAYDRKGDEEERWKKKPFLVVLLTGRS